MADDGKIRRSCKSADDPQTVIETFVKHQGIDRDKEIYSLVRFLNSIGGHYVIALDGGWGCGKSFFVRHTMLFLEYYAGNYSSTNICDKDERKIYERCEEIWGNHVGQKSKKDEIFYYDAWKNDAFGDDPIISLLCEIVEENKSKFGKVCDYIQNRVSWKAIFILVLCYIVCYIESFVSDNWVGRLIKRFSAIVGSVLTAIKLFYKSLFWKSDLRDIQKYVDKEFKNKIFQEKTNTLLHEKISKVLKDELRKRKKSRFIIFIDELDRCNPLFAVKVLERVKHYFDNPNLVFVFSVNLEQLQHTIRNVYGQEFDAMTYLHRFFDKQISLQRPSIDALVRGKLENHASEEFCKVARYAIDCYKFHIREILQFLDELDDVCGAISYLIKTQNLKNDIEFDFDPEKDRGSTVYNAETNAYFFAFDIIIPLLIGLRIKDCNVYDAVLNDKAVNTEVSEHIQRYFRENSNGLWSCALKSWTPEQMSARSLTKQDLDRIYSAMFPLWNHDATATVGQLDFSKRIRERVKELLSGLAKQEQEKKSWDSSYQAYWNALVFISNMESYVLDDGSPDISKDRQDIIDCVKGYYKGNKVIYRTEKHEKAGNILIISLSETVQMEFVWCPAGRFTMGSPDGESEYPIGPGEKSKAELGRWGDEPPHEVTLTKGFWIGKYPVTQAQYVAITGRNPSYFEGDNRPVEKVSWDESVTFCEKLNELKIAPEGYKFALPTEAQWEYACRAGKATALNNGKPVVSVKDWCPNLDEVGWYRENSELRTHPVMEKDPNTWGIYDMHGNVWEWCADWYGAYPGGAVTDPTGPETGGFRVLRGGSWDYYAWGCRSARRNGNDPGFHDSSDGFRLALVPEQKTASA